MRWTEYLAPALAVLLALGIGWLCIQRWQQHLREEAGPQPPTFRLPRTFHAK